MHAQTFKLCLSSRFMMFLCQFSTIYYIYDKFSYYPCGNNVFKYNSSLDHFFFNFFSTFSSTCTYLAQKCKYLFGIGLCFHDHQFYVINGTQHVYDSIKFFVEGFPLILDLLQIAFMLFVLFFQNMIAFLDSFHSLSMNYVRGKILPVDSFMYSFICFDISL